MKYLKWFIAAVRPYLGRMFVMLMCHLVLAFCSIAFVFVSKVLVDMAVAIFSSGGASGITSFPFRDPTTGNLAIWACAMVGIMLLRIGLNSVRSWLQTKTEIALKNSLRRRLFDALMHRESLSASRHHTGDMVSRLQEDVRMVSSTFASSVPGLIGTSMHFLAAFAFFLYLDFRLALILVFILPVGMLVGKYVTRRIRNLTGEIRKSDSKVQSHLQESIQHLIVLQSLDHARTSISELDSLQGTLYDNEMRRTRFSVVSRIVISVAFSAGQAIAFLWGVVGISSGTVTYGMMTAFLQLVAQIQRPLMEMSSQLPAIIHSTASIDRLMEIESVEREDQAEPVLLNAPAGVRFENVSFAYPDGKKNVLEGFSWDFKPGTRTAIMGPTGVGKSTMIRLMMAFLHPQEGRISVYDSSCCEEVSPALRCNMVFVPQGNSLFSGTIRDNLLMGNPDADDKALWDVLHLAAADFVSQLPEGLDSQCFEAGAGLSEGQAQRIAIARALLRPGSILLLDEFTSALDRETENLMMSRLTSSLPDKTMIFITHREGILPWCTCRLDLGNKK